MFNDKQEKPEITGIICTRNRADLLRNVLVSLTNQTLPKSKFEIEIIDDGSNDHTQAVVSSFQETLPLRYTFQNHAGLASAKNHAIYRSRGKYILFMDDDDIALPELLEQHLQTHLKFPDNSYAVLGYTDLTEEVANNPLMHYATEIGCYLFSYPHINDGDILDFTYFWGGRSSCKRDFLIEHGVFNPIFSFGCEDIELGWRLSAHNLKVIYNKRAQSRMFRTISFDDFCKRTERQGRSQYLFNKFHQNNVIKRYTEMEDYESLWSDVGKISADLIRSAEHLHNIAISRIEHSLPLDPPFLNLLHNAYSKAFKACKLIGINRQLNDEISKK